MSAVSSPVPSTPGTTSNAPSTSSTVGSVGGVARVALERDHLRGDLLGVHLELERRLLLGEERPGPRERPGEHERAVADLEGALGGGLLVDHEADVGGGGLVDDVADDQLDRGLVVARGHLVDPSGELVFAEPADVDAGQLHVASDTTGAGVHRPRDDQEQHEHHGHEDGAASSQRRRERPFVGPRGRRAEVRGPCRRLRLGLHDQRRVRRRLRVDIIHGGPNPPT